MISNKDVCTRDGVLYVNGRRTDITGKNENNINHYVIDGEAVNIPNAIYLIITNVRNGDPGDDDTFCVTLHTGNNLHARIAGTENCTYTISGDNLNITSISDADEPIDVYTIKLA